MVHGLLHKSCDENAEAPEVEPQAEFLILTEKWQQFSGSRRSARREMSFNRFGRGVFGQCHYDCVRVKSHEQDGRGTADQGVPRCMANRTFGNRRGQQRRFRDRRCMRWTEDLHVCRMHQRVHEQMQEQR